ncbi:MAG: MFS transporter [Flavobacteriales bacterium]
MPQQRKVLFLIIIAALGYFVDIYDLVLFGVVKAESLATIMPNATDALRASTGKYLFNVQMLGMLLGGLLWGVLGDKRGRLKVLFGSILLYSLANILNAFVTDIQSYTAIRLIAGIGLAGELGAGITLISELMPKETRGYGTMIVVTFGALGAVAASLVGAEGQVLGAFIAKLSGWQPENWQVVYLIGGSMGLLLLFLRVGALESGFFSEMQTNTNIRKGQLKLIFAKKENLIKYLHCISIGIPIWYTVGLLVMNSADNFGPLLGVYDISNGKAVMYCYLGLSAGDLLAGFLSQWLKSRKKVVRLYLLFSLAITFVFLGIVPQYNISASTYYFMCFLLGAGTGYWAIFVTIAAEQFGTNIRSTTANTIPNFVRGSVNLVMLVFALFGAFHWNEGLSAMLTGLLFMSLALYSLSQLKETFGKDLNYFEVS